MSSAYKEKDYLYQQMVKKQRKALKAYAHLLGFEGETSMQFFSSCSYDLDGHSKMCSVFSKDQFFKNESHQINQILPCSLFKIHDAFGLIHRFTFGLAY